MRIDFTAIQEPELIIPPWVTRDARFIPPGSGRRQCDVIARVGELIAERYLYHAQAEHVIWTADAAHPALVQPVLGDFLVIGEPWDSVPFQSVEVKSELEHTGNLFLETRIHRKEQDETPGWMNTNKADLLLYVFLWPKPRMYRMDFYKLRAWFFGDDGGRAGQDDYKERKTHKYEGEAWGHCVPVEDLKQPIGLVEVNV